MQSERKRTLSSLVLTPSEVYQTTYIIILHQVGRCKYDLFQRKLGRGSYGEVDDVRGLSTGNSYARKHIHLEADRPPEVIFNEVKNEVAVMQKLRHLHIATVLFYFKEEDVYSIFMLPVAEYDLQKFMDRCTAHDYAPALAKQIYPWFGCLLDALAYAHKLKVKHQDIKLSNMLIKNNQPYLADFGLVKDFAETNASTSRGLKVKGTMVYRAPEVLPGMTRSRKADVFALGAVYSEYFIGRLNVMSVIPCQR